MTDLDDTIRALFSGSEDVASAEAAASVDTFVRAASVSSDIDFHHLAERFRSADIPDAPTSSASYFEYLKDNVLAHSVNVASPHYIGHMTSALPSFVRPLGRLLTTLNQNLVKVETSKALTPYEREALAMIHRLAFRESDAFYARTIQDPEHTLGILTSGGTIANATGLWVARNARLGGVEREGLTASLRSHGFERAVVVGSSLMHYSLEKAADLLGLGASALVRVPVDRDGRVSAGAVREAVVAAEARRELVVAIVGIAGTTDSGAIDPLAELADVATSAGIHFHVDAAWGGPLLFSDRHRARLEGIERASSITIDGHKQLYLPMGIGMVFFRDPAQARAIEKQAAYIIRAGSGDLGKRSLEGSRSGMALFLHAALHILGKQGYAHLIDAGIEKARVMASLIHAMPELELLAPPQINIVNYRYVPAAYREKLTTGALSAEEQDAISAFNVRLQEAQKRDGATFVSRTQLAFTGKSERPIVALRAVLANPLTEVRHIEEVLLRQKTLARALEDVRA
ncbi:MAG: putative pyridoxal-dependent aspartate 1-decarboxylase [Labilithrix sp.]|nr:putative pyridoxal-dependent aspartate 1-decarboxylase [Labilithrix sp.]